jgi:hypothetical protein
MIRYIGTMIRYIRWHNRYAASMFRRARRHRCAAGRVITAGRASLAVGERRAAARQNS